MHTVDYDQILVKTEQPSLIEEASIYDGKD